jgi:tRNA1Val (adenine37-N6)-methyltransferase
MNNIEIELKENEKIEELGYNNYKIIQNKKEFCFGIDSVLLANFSRELKKDANALDLGTGNGIIGILLCGKSKLKKIIGIEIQPQACDMANRSIKINNLENKFEIINSDIKDLEKIISKQSIDAVVTNPPYKKENTGIKNENQSKIIARHEVKCTLEDIIKNSGEVLKDKGEFYMVHKPERLVDIFFILRKYNMEPKFVKFVHSRINEIPKLVLIKAIKNANQFLKIDKPLIIYNNDGSYTNEFLNMCN